MIATSFLHFRNSKLPYRAIRLPLSVQRNAEGSENSTYLVIKGDLQLMAHSTLMKKRVQEIYSYLLALSYEY